MTDHVETPAKVQLESINEEIRGLGPATVLERDARQGTMRVAAADVDGCAALPPTPAESSFTKFRVQTDACGQRQQRLQ
jgi:hypothetical protein